VDRLHRWLSKLLHPATVTAMDTAEACADASG